MNYKNSVGGHLYGSKKYNAGNEFNILEDQIIKSYERNNIDSYPVNDTSANSTNEFIKTEEIPIYTSPVNGTNIDLRNSIDFRPFAANTADDTATVASGATINPSGTEAFAASDHKIAAPNENYEFD